MPAVRKSAPRLLPMKTAYLTHGSALRYWRMVRAGMAPRPRAADQGDLPDAETASFELARHRRWLPFSPNAVLDIGVADKGCVNRVQGFSFHVLGEALCAGSFAQVRDQLMVASPELCFLQASATEKLLPLIELGMELCGSYSLNSMAKRGFDSAPCLASASSLRSMLDAAGGRRGVAIARRALSFIEDGSASPRETELYLMLCLPQSKGGYGMPRPALNWDVNFGKRVRPLDTKEKAVADMCWPDCKVIAEYDGGEDHLGAEDVVADKSRRSMLAALGYRTIVFTKEDVCSAEALNRRVGQLCRALGVRLRCHAGERGLEKRERLRAYLFDPRHLFRSPVTTPLQPSDVRGSR